METNKEDFIREAHTFLPVDLEGREEFLQSLELTLTSIADQSKRELLESNQLIIDAVRKNPNTVTFTVDGVTRTYKLINT